MPAYEREFRFRDSRFFVAWVPDFVGKGAERKGILPALREIRREKRREKRGGEMQGRWGRGKYKRDVVRGKTRREVREKEAC